ncbi:MULTISPECIES: type I polyketide synthase [Bradyrhizobium]|uniref:Type I polyketide synthase n=1 Tax=Bradyrhizobium barranii subsp. barranii TaxID=2823807 RepID=A0A7Z0QMB7_9BRAD|nr:MULTISPECIES: type I polyketide synthase [Bradyrhizobium]MBP2435190.1 acyl transferase domain-containing protein/surfactin synthase thioesterase subunit/acyl carrier protein [Bradyrhizobium elkanii]MBR1004050.1 type I polyketide synthase [Bradyrhizobium liaoningense]MCP1749115.1 acyl transferase domain-containing protein/surfactin synthase thioesterase subunit/acyl carrier protein [Bradyrhizobium japonicum]MCP1855234.1 acyl transferase domain-containing protein/surfactin synthase thioesteras
MTAEPARERGVAIIGIACRLPGASDWRSFWSNLAKGVESITFFDDDALLKAGVDPAVLRDPQYVKAAPVIADFDHFDAGLFEYSPREARVTDPQQRLFLEVAWEAFEDAGYRPQGFDGAVGVFAGAGGLVSSYFASNPSLQGSTGGVEHIGNDKDFIATRVSYKLDLTGPSLTVQTACSTSMVAVNLACRSIMGGECDMALAGAACVRVPHHGGYYFREGDIQSPDGHCRAFDAAAQGTVFGSGVAAVLLKHVEDAIADGDHIYAVIRGSAINNDGAAKISFTASSVSGQAKAMLEAFDRAGVAPDAIDYVETHGTGTVVGDPLEIEALTRVFRTDTTRTGFCAIGSVKTNLGHLEQAAGLASLIKVALALHHGKIPPSLNFKTPNPKIAFAETPFFVNTELRDWPSNGSRRLAAVNALGLGGTNAFAILEEAPPAVPRLVPEADRPLHVLPLSARSEAALRSQIERWRQHISKSGQLLADQCYTAATGRAQLDFRFTAIGSTREQLVEQLTQVAPHAMGIRAGRRPLAFLFTGQGSQYSGMSAELFRTQPVFRAALERCEALSRPHLEVPLLEIIFGGHELIHQTAYTQPALFAVEWALAQLWQSWGIMPDAVIGHSVGEYVAACVAGVYELGAALALIVARGRLMQSLPAGGAMAALFANGPAVEALLGRKIGRHLSIAAYNSPDNTVISGTASAVAEALELAAQAGVQTKQLTVSHAFHSPLMKPILGDLEALAASHAANTPKLALIDNLSGVQMIDAPTPRHWSEHSLKPVRFVEGMRTLAAMGIVDFLEIGPGSTLVSLAQQTLGDAGGAERRYLSSIGKDREWSQLAQAVGALWRSGAPVDWRGFDAAYARRRVSGPTYAFERERYWIERVHRPAPAGQEGLLGQRLKSPLPAWQFETVYDLDRLPWLTDHRIFGHAVLPLTAGLVALTKAARMRLGSAAVAVASLTYGAAMVIPDAGSLVVQALLSSDGDGLVAEIASLDPAHTGEWQQHMAGRIEALQARSMEDLPGPVATSLGIERMRAVAPQDYYAAIEPLGFGYGPGFRGIAELWQGDGAVVGRVALPAHLGASAHELHPALLDACLHTYPALIPDYRDLAHLPPGSDGTYLPISIERFEIYRSGVDRAWVVCSLRESDGGKTGLTVDIRIFTEDGTAVALMAGLNVRRLTQRVIAPESATSIVQSIYAVQWIEKPALAALAAEPRNGWLILGESGGLGEVLAQRLGQQNLSATVQDPRRWKKAADPDNAIRKAAKRPGGLHGVVLMHALDVQTSAKMSVEEIAAAEAHCCRTALQVMKMLAAWAESGEPVPRVWIVTRASQSPEPQATGGDPLHASLWGLGRVAALEHPELWGGMIDLGDDGDVDGLVGELLGSDGEMEIALRAAGRYAPRLVQEQLTADGDHVIQPSFDAESTYLVTGGLGALGLVVANWLVERRGVRHLVLTARRPPGEAAAAVLKQLQDKGAQVIVKAADIARPDDVSALFTGIASDMPRLKGVFHCAGLLDDGVLLQMEWDKYIRVTQPKVLGGWLLHQATRGLDIDHFVLFSSVLSVVGSMGQVNYVAGNAFLDGLAEHRRRAGLPAQVINWGPWAETGLATESGKRGEAIWRSRGTRYIPADEGIEALQAIMARRLQQAVVSITDWSLWAGQYPSAPPFLQAVARGKAQAAQPSGDRGAILARLAAAPADSRRDVLVDVVSGLVRSILEIPGGINPEQPLRELGLDSLIAITLINQLDATLGVRVAAATMLKGPSVAQLADELLPRINVDSAQIATHEGGTAPAVVVATARHSEASKGRWLVEIRRNPDARYRLICFPFAGGGSAVYRGWAESAEPNAEILAIEPPGRLARINEAPLTRIDDFVEDLLPQLREYLDRPVALFGHCIGGLTMYEVARTLVEREGVVPLHLFASGSRPPHRLIRDAPFEKRLASSLLELPAFRPTLPSYRQPDAVLAEILRHFRIDATVEMLSITELRELVLPVVRAEFEMASRYVFTPATPWQIPITSFRGQDDEYVSHDDGAAWADLTDGPFNLLTRQGAHFGVVEDRPFIQGVIAQSLALN